MGHREARYRKYLLMILMGYKEQHMKTLQELRMLFSVTLDCQVTKIVMNSGSQLSEL